MPSRVDTKQCRHSTTPGRSKVRLRRSEVAFPESRYKSSLGHEGIQGLVHSQGTRCDPAGRSIY